jgi:hypothetical protein
MQQTVKSEMRPSGGSYWRHLLIAGIAIASFLAIFSRAPFGQDQNYHNFADSRPFLGIPNFGDVASNLGFLIVGLIGLKVCITKQLGPLRNAWIVMFAGIAIVGIGSTYYHWNPNDDTLVWDRMSLTVGFMGLFVGFLGEYISERFRFFLVPAVLIGVFSVLYWSWFQDLRLYYWVQLIPLLILPFVMMLYPARYSHQWLFLAGVIWYGLAKLAELGDKVVFAATGGLISGHTIKHVLAAVGCASILVALKIRIPIRSRSGY